MHLPQKSALVKEANKMIYENSAFTGLFCLSFGKVIYCGYFKARTASKKAIWFMLETFKIDQLFLALDLPLLMT